MDSGSSTRCPRASDSGTGQRRTQDNLALPSDGMASRATLVGTQLTLFGAFVLRCFALHCIIDGCRVHRQDGGELSGDRIGRLRDGDGIPVQSTAELACATAGLGSSAGLAAFARMAGAS